MHAKYFIMSDIRTGMNYWEGLSLLSFAFGSISLVVGIFLSIYVESYNVSTGNSIFYAGFALLIVFWAIAIGIKSYSRGSKQVN